MTSYDATNMYNNKYNEELAEYVNKKITYHIDKKSTETIKNNSMIVTSDYCHDIDVINTKKYIERFIDDYPSYANVLYEHTYAFGLSQYGVVRKACLVICSTFSTMTDIAPESYSLLSLNIDNDHVITDKVIEDVLSQVVDRINHDHCQDDTTMIQKKFIYHKDNPPCNNISINNSLISKIEDKYYDFYSSLDSDDKNNCNSVLLDKPVINKIEEQYYSYHGDKIEHYYKNYQNNLDNYNANECNINKVEVVDYDSLSNIDSLTEEECEEAMKSKVNEVIQNLPVTAVKKDTDELCSICQTEYRQDDMTLTLPCFHIFHDECCKAWLHQSKQCPICLHSVV